MYFRAAQHLFHSLGNNLKSIKAEDAFNAGLIKPVQSVTVLSLADELIKQPVGCLFISCVQSLHIELVVQLKKGNVTSQLMKLGRGGFF